MKVNIIPSTVHFTLYLLSNTTTNAYAGDNSSDSFSSAFIIAFCAYAALIIVLHFTEFIRLKLFKKNVISPKQKLV